MKIDAKCFNDPVMAILELPLVYFIYFIAISTIMFMVGLSLSAKFSTVSHLIPLSMLIAAVPVWLQLKMMSKIECITKANGLFAFVALSMSLTVGIISSSINRPDIDDSVYIPTAVFYLENQNQELSKNINWIAGLTEEPTAILFYYYEIIQASLASIISVHLLDVYHIAFPIVVGFLMCLSMLLVISVFEIKKWRALLGVVLLIFVLFSLGETHRTFGNMSIARIFQGKVMFMAFGVPAWIYFSLQFLALKKISSWFILLALGISMAGVTSTAMVFLPLMSSLIFISYLFNNRDVFNGDNIIISIKYFSSLVPVILMALDFHSVAVANIPSSAEINSGFPMDFGLQLRLIINSEYPLTPFLFVLSLIVTLLYSGYRRFFICWSLLAYVFLLNPLVSEFVINNITSQNIYWRLFYIMPFPIIVAVSFLAVLGDGAKSKISSVVLMVSFFIMAFWGPTSVIRSDNGSKLALPGYKIHEPALSAIKEIASTSLGGSMFAPLEISSNLLIFSSKYPQFHMREDYLRFTLNKSGFADDLDARSKLYRFLYHDEPSLEGKIIFDDLLSLPNRPFYFVVRENTARVDEIHNILVLHNYKKRSLSKGIYALYESTRTQ